MCNFPPTTPRRLLNHLTAVKLAGQILEHKTTLTAYQRHLVATMLQAADELTVDLLEIHAVRPLALSGRTGPRGRAARGRTAGAPAPDRIGWLVASLEASALGRFVRGTLASPIMAFRGRGPRRARPR